MISEVYHLRCVVCRAVTKVSALPKEQPFCEICCCPLILDKVTIITVKDILKCQL